MKVTVGKYLNWIGPFQFAEILCFWTKTEDEYGLTTYPDWVHDFGDKLSNSWVMPICNWIHSKKKRKEKVKIHKYDSWSADHTLSLVIVPVLEQLQKTKHGSPQTEDADAPIHLRSTSAKPFDPTQGETDEYHFKRWDWILSEMIWAFKQIRDDDWEAQYHTGEHDIQWKEIPKENKDDEQLSEMILGPKDTHKFDADGYTKHFERIKNGTTLFGKYYSNLWD